MSIEYKISPITYLGNTKTNNFTLDTKKEFKDYIQSSFSDTEDTEIVGDLEYGIKPTDFAQWLVQEQTQSTLPYDLAYKSIEEVFGMAGLTQINGKKIKFGSSAVRDKNASLGAKNSHHKYEGLDGTANARDVSIVGGDISDYALFKMEILSNPIIMEYLNKRGWGIINEITPEILSMTNGTGKHFHFGPDKWAVRTLNHWINNPNELVTKYIKAQKGTKLNKRFKNE